MKSAADRGNVPTQAEFQAAIAARADRWYSACLRITRNPDLAEDAVQEALLSAWDKRSQFAGNAALETWIHRIAVNAALQLVRKQRPARFESLDGEVPDDGDGPEDGLALRELGDTLGAALAHLTELERVCFVLKHLEQWRVREIMTELDANESAVKQAIFRGVRKLRERLPDPRSDRP